MLRSYSLCFLLGKSISGWQGPESEQLKWTGGLKEMVNPALTEENGNNLAG